LRAPAFGATRKPIRTSQLAGIASESNVDDALMVNEHPAVRQCVAIAEAIGVSASSG